MGDRSNPHKQRLRPEPIGRSAVVLVPEVRQMAKKTIKKKTFSPIKFSPDVQRAIKLGRAVRKLTEERLQLELSRNPNMQMEIVTLTDKEIEEIFNRQTTQPFVEEDNTRPSNPFDSKDFIDTYDDYFSMTIS